MGLLQELAKRFMSPAEDLFWGPNRIEATVGDELEDCYVLHIRPAETMYGGPVGEAMKIVDASSLHLQTMAQANFGLCLPDIRFRVITEMNSDSFEGDHFGTLAGARKKAEKIKDRVFGIIDGTARKIVFPQLPSLE